MKEHCPNCGWGTVCDSGRCRDCGSQFVEDDEEEVPVGAGWETHVPRSTVAGWFITIYFLPMVVQCVRGLLGDRGSQVWIVYYALWYICWFPSGLIGLLDDTAGTLSGSALWTYSAFGYVAYGLYLWFMLWLRKRWQTVVLAMLLLLLVALNLKGCSVISERCTRGMTISRSTSDQLIQGRLP